jgi:hypothetical protein
MHITASSGSLKLAKNDATFQIITSYIGWTQSMGVAERVCLPSLQL